MIEIAHSTVIPFVNNNTFYFVDLLKDDNNIFKYNDSTKIVTNLNLNYEIHEYIGIYNDYSVLRSSETLYLFNNDTISTNTLIIPNYDSFAFGIVYNNTIYISYYNSYRQAVNFALIYTTDFENWNDLLNNLNGVISNIILGNFCILNNSLYLYHSGMINKIIPNYVNYNNIFLMASIILSPNSQELVFCLNDVIIVGNSNVVSFIVPTNYHS